MGRPDADSGRADGGGGIGRPDAETGPGGRGGGGVEPGANGRAGGAGGRAAVVGGMPAGIEGRGALGLGRPLEMKPLRVVSPVVSAGAGAGAASGVGAGATGSAATGSATAGAGALGASTTGAWTTGASTTSGASTTTGASTAEGASTAAGSGAGVSAGSSAFLAAAFFGAAFLAAAFFTGLSAPGSPSSVVFAAAFLTAAFLTGLGSSGCSSRMRPSRSARRRTRSACASMMDDEWLFTSIPITTQRSTASLLVRPSSLASSCTRMFFGNLTSAFHYRFIGGPLVEVLTGPRVVRAQCTAEISTVECGIDTR